MIWKDYLFWYIQPLPSAVTMDVKGNDDEAKTGAISELLYKTRVILLNNRVGFTSVFRPRTLTVVFLASIVLTLSIRRSLISVNFLPVISDAYFRPISSIVTVDRFIWSLFLRGTKRSISNILNGECTWNHLLKWIDRLCPLLVNFVVDLYVASTYQCALLWPAAVHHR